MTPYHTTVLLREAVDGLEVKPGGTYVDATYGGGGHSALIVERGGTVFAFDADADAIARASGIQHPGVTLIHANFRDMAPALGERGISSVDGILFDLGVSGHQFDEPERGFSYRFGNAPLDMRFDVDRGYTAADFLATARENELYEVFAKYGEEERAGVFARAVVGARQVKALETAADLMAVIEAHTGSGDRLSVAARIFQALRIKVNDEMGALGDALSGSEKLLVRGGRLSVISFHSLEDRIVKLFIAKPPWKRITGKPIVADGNEVSENKRARSAKLRIAEKV